MLLSIIGADRGSKYGAQRAWGTAGYGVTALLGGWLIDVVSGASRNKDFTPAFIIAIVATVVDLGACRKLNVSYLFCSVHWYIVSTVEALYI